MAKPARLPPSPRWTRALAVFLASLIWCLTYAVSRVEAQMEDGGYGDWCRTHGYLNCPPTPGLLNPGTFAWSIVLLVLGGLGLLIGIAWIAWPHPKSK